MEQADIRKCLSANIKKYRKEKGFSQFDLSVQADVSGQTINSIESCRLWPSDKTLVKIANVLNVEIYKLFIPQEIDIPCEVENQLRLVITKSIEKIVGEILR